MWHLGSVEIQQRAHYIAALVADLSPKERRDYSFCRAILAAGGDKSLAGPETELSAAIAKKLNRESAGVYVATNLRAAGLDTRTNSAGGYTVQTEVRDVIELLRNKAKVIKAGGTLLSGLQGNQSFPKQAGASNGSWVAQNPGSDMTDSDSSFGVLSLSPKTYQASTSF